MVRLNGAKQRAQRGFTLLEMMIVVVVIAILAIIVVPTFFKEGRKTKSTSEVSAMFAELSVKLEQFKVENGTYTDLAQCPSTTSATGSPSATCQSLWIAARVNPPEATLKCSYIVRSGPATTPPTDSDYPGFTMGVPATSWYWMLATCDMDGSPTRNAMYFTNSVDSTIQKLNEGF